LTRSGSLADNVRMAAKLKQPSAKPHEKVKKSVYFIAEHARRAEELGRRKGVDFSAIVQMALAEKLERESK
jgi:hypothetical protein